MDKEKLIKEMQKRAKVAREYRKEREETGNPDIWLLSKKMPTKLKTRQFIYRATNNELRGIKDLYEDVKAKRKQIETLYDDRPSYNQPGYKYYRNSKVLLEFIEDEFLNRESEKENEGENELTLSEMKEIAEKRWKELLAEDHSENEAAKIISGEINNQRAPKTIKNWMHPEYT